MGIVNYPTSTAYKAESQFTDTVFVDNGIQQLGTMFAYSNFIAEGGEGFFFPSYDLFIETTVPCFSYVMIMVEITGFSIPTGGFMLVPERGAGIGRLFKQSWNFYTYSYDIGNTNYTSYRGGNEMNIEGSSSYCFDGVRQMLQIPIGNLTKFGFVLDIYAVAGNGARYPVEILNMYASCNNC